ncbi:recombinase family protein [Neobacillus soli]|uniref:recombinase family protein n=1 Tax=Neobacillus soli TaxID=220688 RepID=UPI0009FDDD65
MKKDRPQLNELLKYTRPGDEIVVFKHDRIRRSLMYLEELVEDFNVREIEFISLHEKIDTTTAMEK